MLKSIRKGYDRAYRAGYMAGYNGLDSVHNPYPLLPRFLCNVAWWNGWHDGMTAQLNDWLKDKKEGK